MPTARSTGLRLQSGCKSPQIISDDRKQSLAYIVQMLPLLQARQAAHKRTKADGMVVVVEYSFFGIIISSFPCRQQGLQYQQTHPADNYGSLDLSLPSTLMAGQHLPAYSAYLLFWYIFAALFVGIFLNFQFYPFITVLNIVRSLCHSANRTLSYPLSRSCTPWLA